MIDCATTCGSTSSRQRFKGVDVGNVPATVLTWDAETTSGLGLGACGQAAVDVIAQRQQPFGCVRGCAQVVLQLGFKVDDRLAVVDGLLLELATASKRDQQRTRCVGGRQ